MAWVAVATVAAGAIGAAVSSDSARKAAHTQADAAKNATGLQQGIYNDTVQRNAPFVAGGTTAFNALLGRLGLNGGEGSLGHVPTAAEVQATPGYQFGMDQGQQALNHQLTASGWGGSGAAAKAAARYGTDYATTKYNNAFNNLQAGNQQVYNQLSGVAGLGQQSANNTSAYGSQFGAQAGNNMMGAANAQAAGTIAQGNAWTGALNQGVSAYQTGGFGGGGSMSGFGSMNAGGNGSDWMQGKSSSDLSSLYGTAGYG